MIDLAHHARALQRLADAAQAVANGIPRALSGDLSRQAAMLAVDLAAMARRVETEAQHAMLHAVELKTQNKRCPRCTAQLGVDGICEQCEGM